MEPCLIGCGAGFSGDRFDACLSVIEALRERTGPRYLTFELLAERTLALALRTRREDPERGFSPFAERYLEHALAPCLDAGIRIVSNMGAANPVGAAGAVHAICRRAGLRAPRVAIVEGDDLLANMSASDITALPTLEGLPLDAAPIAANVYLGARPIADALALDADVVLTGRCADAALALGPLLHEFGWADDALDLLAAGTLAGHLIECGAQVTGAYFADPGYKDVEGLARVGFPIAEVDAGGGVVIGKPEGSGGCVTTRTVKEQLLYEVHDPAAYLTPDVTLDLTEVDVLDEGDDRVRLTGARGRPPPETLKATVCMDGGWLGEAEISYAGPNAFARAAMAADVVRARWRLTGRNEPLRTEIIGACSVHAGDAGPAPGASANLDGDYRLRAATRAVDRAGAEAVCHEVLHLYCSGPAGGGGVRQHTSPQVKTASVCVPRDAVQPSVRLVEARP